LLAEKAKAEKVSEDDPLKSHNLSAINKSDMPLAPHQGGNVAENPNGPEIIE
jgi:hypothetical protein